MKRSVKRFVSLLLVTVMVLSTNVSYAFANEIPASDMSGETIEIQSDLQTVSDSANGDVSGDLNQSEQSSDALSESEPEISETVTESVITEDNTVVDDSEEGSLTDAKQTLEEDIDTTLESVVEEESEIEEELQSELDSNMPGRNNITDFRILHSYNECVDICFNVDNSVENYIKENLAPNERLMLEVHMGFDASELSDKGLTENEKVENPVGSMSGPCSRILIGDTSNPRGDRNGDGIFYINITDIYKGGTVFLEPYDKKIKANFSFQFIVLDQDGNEVRYGEKTQDEAESCTITSHTTITFDANGGTMSYLDERYFAYEGEPGAYTSETYEYFESDSGKWDVSIDRVDALDPHREGSVFLGWYDSKDENSEYPYDFFPTNETRVYKAKWRDTFKNIPVEFYGANYTVEKYDPSDEWNLDVDGDTFSFNADEGKTYRFKIKPDEGYELADMDSIHSSVGSTFADGKYYVFKLGESRWRDSAPDKIIIEPVVVKARAKDEQYSYVIYNPDAAKVKITEKNNEGNVIEPVSEGIYHNNQIRGFYLLKTGTKYKVEISCNANYKFNDRGIGVRDYNNDEGYFKKAQYSNQNTRKTYSSTFTAGRKTIEVNSDPLYSPIVKVKNSDGQYEEITPVNGIYNVKYTDDIKLFLQRGNWFAKLYNKIKDGTKVLNDWYVTTEDNGFWLKLLDAEAQKYYGKTLSVEMYDPENQYGTRVGYGPKATFKLKVSTPITSTTVNGVTKANGRQTLSPALGEEKVCTVSVNPGASIENLGFMYSDGTTECSFLDTKIENGKLYVKANAGCRVGKTVDIILYDKENPIDWDKQDVTNGKITVTTAAPAWAKTAPTVTLASANDIKLEFNVKAPKGLALDDNYWIAVKLAPNSKTKIKDSDYSINEDVSYFHVNSDGTIPRIVVNVFKKNDSSIVETLGKGFGTSLDAMVWFMTTEGGAKPTADSETSNILVAGADKKITVATKEPYYADKITLKKGVTKLYAGDEDKIVATVDFGKNATYTRADDWEILNKSELEGKGITAAQEGDNKVKISVAETTPVGKYTVEVGTIGNGVPAKASVQIEVAQTATTLDVGISKLNIYHNPKKDITAKVKPVMYDQDGKVIKSAKFTYKIVENDEPLSATDKTLTVNNSGTVKVAKGFVLKSGAEYKLVVTGTVGKTVDADPVTIKIIEANPKIDSIEIGGTDVETISDITLKDYFEIVENLSIKEDNSLDYLPATIGLADNINRDAIVINEDKDGKITAVEDLSVIKEVKIPNPAYITKTGKIAISVTTMAGITKKIEFKIVADTGATYDALEVSAMTSDGTKAILPDDSVGKIWTVKGSTLQNYVINLKNSSNETETTKKNISGDKLSVKGAKIVKNWHGDCIQIVMTSKTATITRKHGSKIVGTYSITNNAFASKAPKVTADRNSKLYTNFDKTQTVNYTLDKVYGDLDHLRISSTNADINEWIESGNIVVNVLDEKTFSITVYGEASKVKAAKYPITVEFVDGGGASICPATTTNLEFKTLKKSFKPVTSYTMSDSDMTSVVFKASSSAGVKSIVLNSILNDNIKGKYNSIAEIFGVDNDTKNGPYLKIQDVTSLPGAGKSITGYVKYTVNYADGSQEDKLDKVTIKIAKNVRKYTSDTKKILLADVGESIEGIQVYADKQPVNIVNANIIKTTDKAKVSSLKCVDGKLSIALKKDVVKKTGTVKLTVNVIPEGSLWAGESPVDEKNSIPVAVKINVAR